MRNLVPEFRAGFMTTKRAYEEPEHGGDTEYSSENSALNETVVDFWQVLVYNVVMKHTVLNGETNLGGAYCGFCKGKDSRSR